MLLVERRRNLEARKDETRLYTYLHLGEHILALDLGEYHRLLVEGYPVKVAGGHLAPETPVVVGDNCDLREKYDKKHTTDDT